LKRELDAGSETHPLAEDLFDRLHHLSTRFLGVYFRAQNAAPQPIGGESMRAPIHEAPGNGGRQRRLPAVRSG
jgi:hypothetical protein